MAVVTFVAQRVALTAEVVAPVYPPTWCNAVIIGNATSDDLRVHSTPYFADQYFVVPAGYERAIRLENFRFGPTDIGFYLAAVVTGTAVLIWS